MKVIQVSWWWWVLSSCFWSLNWSRRESPNRRAYAACLYWAHVKGLYKDGLWAVTIFDNGLIHQFNGGAAKYIIDILGFVVFVNTLCLTLTNLPFVKTYTKEKTQLLCKMIVMDTVILSKL